MQISLTQAEIREALLDYLNHQIALQPGQTIVLEFDLDNTVKPAEIVADVFIRRQGQKQSSTQATTTASPTFDPGPTPTPSAPAKPAGRGPGRPPKNPTPPAPPANPAPEAASTDPGEVVEDRQISTGDERNDPDNTPIEDDAEGEGTITDPLVETPPAVKSAIFPNAGTSAPVTATPPAPTGKSLFANLTKPVHDAPKTTAH